MPVGLEPARGRALSGRAASEAGAYLRSKCADVPPPLPYGAFEPVSPRDAGSLLLDAGGTRTREGASVKRTRSVRSRCVFAQQMRGRPTAPTIWSFRARVPKGCGLVSFTRRWGSKLRWNSSCFGSLPAHLGTIPPQLRLVFPHFPMEKRGYLPHFPMEKRGCLPHFPMETPKWPYTSREGWEAICSDSL